MVQEFNGVAPPVATSVTCMECGTELGGEGQPDAYSHMLHCLNVTPDKVERIMEVADSNKTENGKRVVHLCKFILANG